jgi:hypothetical protein
MDKKWMRKARSTFELRIKSNSNPNAITTQMNFLTTGLSQRSSLYFQIRIQHEHQSIITTLTTTIFSTCPQAKTSSS